MNQDKVYLINKISKNETIRIVWDKNVGKHYIGVGKNNCYGHPNDGILDNLEDSKMYRTDQNRSIIFKIKDNKLKIDTCSP